MSLLNLAINANHAMPDGGILKIETANEALEYSEALSAEGLRSGEYVVISITDTGIGMTKEVAAEAVRPFFTTKEAGEGSGLGLSMVYGFVSQSGGQFAIRSEVGKGTVVRLYLPRADNAAAAIAREAGPEEHGNGSGERILVVEDRHAVRRTARRMLAGLGYDVIEAADGDDALDLLSGDGHVDLLFTDIVLPGRLNGLSLAREARIQHPDLKVLYTSGYPQDALQKEATDLGQIELIRKPFTKNELARLVRKTLSAEPAASSH